MTRTEGLAAVLDAAVQAEEWELVAHIALILSNLRAPSRVIPVSKEELEAAAQRGFDASRVDSDAALYRALSPPVTAEERAAHRADCHDAHCPVCQFPTRVAPADDPAQAAYLVKGVCPDHPMMGLDEFINDSGNIRGWCAECKTWWKSR